MKRLVLISLFGTFACSTLACEAKKPEAAAEGRWSDKLGVLKEKVSRYLDDDSRLGDLIEKAKDKLDDFAD